MPHQKVGYSWSLAISSQSCSNHQSS